MDYVINFWALCTISAHLNVIANRLTTHGARQTDRSWHVFRGRNNYIKVTFALTLSAAAGAEGLFHLLVYHLCFLGHACCFCFFRAGKVWLTTRGKIPVERRHGAHTSRLFRAN